MKKILCISVALLAWSFASAQTGSSDQTQGSNAPDQSTKTMKSSKKGGATLTGCLSGPNDEGAYLLKHGKKEVEVGGMDDLSKHVGHEVKLHGSWAKSGSEVGEKEGSEKSEAAEGKKGSAGERHFKVTSIDHISDTCPAAGSSAGGGRHHHHHAGAAAGTTGGAEGASPSPTPTPQP